jgi:hypothetical protein
MSDGDGFVKKETRKEKTSGNPKLHKKKAPANAGAFLLNS